MSLLQNIVNILTKFGIIIKKKTREHLGLKISILKIVKTLQNLCIDSHIDLHTIDVI